MVAFLEKENVDRKGTAPWGTLIHTAHIGAGLQNEFRAKLKDKPSTTEPSLNHSNCNTSAAEFQPAAKACDASKQARWKKHQEAQRWPDLLDQGALPGPANRKQGKQGRHCQQSLQTHVLKMGPHL